MLTTTQQKQKRLFDILVASVGIALTWWLILLAWMVATIETRSNGFFVQRRIGKGAKPFWVYKIKTMREVEGVEGSVTTADDRRITQSGAFFRRTKIDELPQLFNVLFGQMSFVGPRPDVEGYADRLEGEDRVILTLRPGITGPASLKYRDEEEILAKVENPQAYNDSVIWPDKVAINKAYLKKWTLQSDIGYMVRTLRG